MKENIYVFGFDNTLVNSEDIIIDAYNKIFNINITKVHWYSTFHSVKDPETEFKMIENEYNIKFTDETMKKCGEYVFSHLTKKEPNKNVYKLLKDNINNSYFLTGSPLNVCEMYFKVEIPEDRMYCGIYNGSGDKEKILKELSSKYDVIYLDDDAELVTSAKKIVTKAILVKHQYNENSWEVLNTIDE